MPIIITSKTNGFRRCGIAHTTTPTEYSDESFTKDQLEALKSEPNLVVQVIDEAKADDPVTKKQKKDTPDPAQETGK